MEKQMTTLEVKRLIDATPEAAWNVISDMEGYADLTTDGIIKVEVLEGAGEGMLRQCMNNQQQVWAETCTRWDEGREFQFTVHTDADDYPYPIEVLRGAWRVEPRNGQTQIVARFEYRLKGGLLGQVMGLFSRGQAIKDSEYMLDKWAQKAQRITE